MTNPRFLLANLADDAVLSGSATVTGLPLANLQIPNRYAVCRSTGTSLSIVADLLTSQAVDFVALLGLNGTATMTRRVRVSANSDLSSPTHDSGTAAADIDALRGQWVQMISSPATGRYVGIDIADAAVSQLEAGYLGIGLSWRPTHAHRHGGRRYVRDLSVVTQSDGGNTFVDRRRRLRCWAFEMQVDRAESEGGEADDEALLLGRSGSVWAVRDPAASPPASQLYWGLLSTEAELNDLTYPLRTMPMTLVERA